MTKHEKAPPPNKLEKTSHDLVGGQAPEQVKLADEIERLKQELKQAKDQSLRTLAEFENTKKRLRREQEEFIRFAAETMVRELLPIVDSLDQALVAVDKQSDPEAIIKGVHLIHRQLLGLLEKEGVKRIPTVGEPFDPHKHEAVAQVEATDGTADERIIEEVQVGYTMYGKVIRPAMVKVAKAKDSKANEAAKQQVVEDGFEPADG